MPRVQDSVKSKKLTKCCNARTTCAGQFVSRTNMNSCKCSAVTNLNRTGAWAIPEGKLINEFSSEEVATAKTTWAEIGVNVLDMTVVYICSVCAQHWGESPAGHGWSSYRRISSEYSFEKSKK